MSLPVYINDFTRNTNQVVTVGTFDGVHLGHQALLDHVVRRSREKKIPAVVVTFDPHPREILDPSSGRMRLLTTLHERASILGKKGIDHMVVIPFTRDFSMLGSEAFIRKYVYRKIGVETFVIGYDHHFGRDRQGSIRTLRELSKELDFHVYVEKAHEVQHTTVSSTLIRNLLEREGDVEQAAEMLGYSYAFTGTVVKGDQRGRTLGFPTANLVPENRSKVLPAKGVYYIEAEIDRQVFGGMMNIGTRPTFMDDQRIVAEAHLLNFERDIYGNSMKVKFLKKLRDEKKFKGPRELAVQLERDLDKCRQLLESDKGKKNGDHS